MSLICPAMNINSISLAPHAADRAAENQDRRKWVSWMKEIEKKVEKDVSIEFFQNTYCTIHEIERGLEKYPEDFVEGEEPTWWVMGSSKTEPPRKTERQQKSAPSSGQRSQTAGGSVPQPGAPSGGSQASDAVRIDNEIIDSIFRMNSGGDDDRWVIINPTAGHDTYTSFEGGITLGGATVNVKFNIDYNTGYPILQTVFGPCLAEGKSATYWECMLRCLTSSLLHFEEKTSAEKIILSYVGKGNAAWLQLYAFLCAQTGCLFTGRLPGAKAINALIQAEKNPDNAPGQLNRIIKRQKRSPIREATIRDMMINKKSFLVLDWPLRAVNAKGSTKTFQMMVNEQGWTNIEERSYYGSSEQVSSPNDTLNIISRLQKLDKLIAERRRRDMDDSPMSVHIWMSLYDWVCMRGCGWQVTANPVIDSLQKAISDLVNTCKGLVVVCVNRDVAFHGGRGDLGTIANKVSEICKAAGALVTENDRLWRVVHALTGKNYKIPGNSNLQHFLLKRLLIEKSIDAVAPSNTFVRELEEMCISEPDLRFNIPKNMEESKVKFEYKPTFTAQSKRKQEQQNEGHGEQDAFGKADVSDPRLRWYTVTELSKFICELCDKEMQKSKSKVLGPNSKYNPSSCVNCCANWNADTNGIARSIEGKKMYTRLFAECVVAIPDLQNLMVGVNNIQAMITIIRELAYSKLKKELSHVGFVSMTVDQAAQFYNNGHGRQLCASRDVFVCKNSEGVEERMSIFLIDKDLGNVAYSSWIKSVLDQGTMYELLGQTTNEESLGDVVEMVLGFFEVMSYFQHELPLWKDAWKIKREFEQSIIRHLAGNVNYTTGQNRKRNRPSAQLGVPTREVLDIMNKVKPRHPRSLITEPSVQGSKRKATEGEDEGLGQAPDPSRSSQPNAEKEDKKQRVLDGRRAALGFLESMEKCMGDMGICKKCANLAHDGDCKDIEEAAGTEKAMKMLRELLSSDPVSSDEDMGDAEEPSSPTSKERKKGGRAGKETIEMYSYTINLVEMADTAEGGELQCGGVDLTYNPCGDSRTFKKTLEIGCDTIPCYIPKYGDVCDVHMPRAYASIVDPRYFPRGAILEQVDVMQLGKSVNFCIAPFDGAPLCRIGDDRSVFATRDQANQLSHDLCRVLRHKIGNCRGSAFRCDEGGWVDIDAVIDDRNNDIFPPSTSRAKRYMGIMEVIKWQESGHKKSRFQVLAVRFPSIMNPNDTRAAREEMTNAGVDRDDIDRMFNRCDGWYRPWCIRVTTGHSDFGFMSSSALANRYSARMGDSLGGAFHVTYVENLPSIVRCGLVPGGIDGGNRLALHFGAFAPWDEMNVATKTTLRNVRRGDPIAIIYIPSATLARYGAGVAANGTFMVFDVIPFYEVKSIWIGKSNGGKRLEYVDVKRAYSKCVENEICPGFVNSSQESAAMFLQNVTKISERMAETETGADNLHYIVDMVDRACELYRADKMEEFNAQVNEVRDEVSKVVIMNDETWEGLRCRICPSCATAIPTCFCLCLECGAQLISIGRYYIHINSDDEEDNQNPNVSGDARRAQEEANHDAAAQEDEDETEEVPEEEDDDMDTQGYTSGYASEEDDSGCNYRDTDLTSRDIINSQRMAICLDEPREAQYMAGFIALQMSKMWGMFEGGEERTMNAELEGKPGCPYHNDFKKYPNITDQDQEGILLPSTAKKISQSENVRTRSFRSVEERDEYIHMMVCKCEGLYTFYKLWIAARILDVTKEEMKLLVKDRVHPVGDIIFRCFALAFNCKYISFVRDGLNLGKYGYAVNVSAIISAVDPNKCDTPLLDWCLRQGHWLPEDYNKKCVRAREAQKNLDEEFRRRTHRLSIGDRYA